MYLIVLSIQLQLLARELQNRFSTPNHSSASEARDKYGLCKWQRDDGETEAEAESTTSLTRCSQ